MSDIIRLVLEQVAGLDCGRLPKPTYIRYMAFEQALLSKHVAKEAIATSTSAVTMMMDGTSNKHQSYVTMLAFTDTYRHIHGLGLQEVATETADALRQEAILAMTELLVLEKLDSEATQMQVKELLLKVKNTMTDPCVVNYLKNGVKRRWQKTPTGQILATILKKP